MSHPNQYGKLRQSRNINPRSSSLVWGKYSWRRASRRTNIQLCECVHWWQVTTQLKAALKAALVGLKEKRFCDGCSSKTGEKPSNAPEGMLVGNSIDPATYCGLAQGPILAYPSWSSLPPKLWKRIICAYLFAILVQWGITRFSSIQCI